MWISDQEVLHFSMFLVFSLLIRLNNTSLLVGDPYMRPFGPHVEKQTAKQWTIFHICLRISSVLQRRTEQNLLLNLPGYLQNDWVWLGGSSFISKKYLKNDFHRVTVDIIVIKWIFHCANKNRARISPSDFNSKRYANLDLCIERVMNEAHNSSLIILFHTPRFNLWFILAVGESKPLMLWDLNYFLGVI